MQSLIVPRAADFTAGPADTVRSVACSLGRRIAAMVDSPDAVDPEQLGVRHIQLDVAEDERADPTRPVAEQE